MTEPNNMEDFKQPYLWNRSSINPLHVWF